MDAAFFDFQKAFDLVDNDVLLMKFSSLRFCLRLFKFMGDYVRDRRQFVRVENYESRE